MDRVIRLLMVGNVLVLAALLAGCDEDHAGADDEDLGAVQLRPGSGAGGVWLNTNAIGTHAFSEIDLKEAPHDGVRMIKVSIPGPNATWLELDKIEFEPNGQLRGKRGTTTYKGAALVGSKWDLKLIQGSLETPAVMSITAHEEAEPGEFRYTFHYNDVNGVQVPVCDPDPQGDIAAVPIKNIHVDDVTGQVTGRADTLYLACTSGAVGKAVDWGYKPWKRSIDEFETAIRMVRADYCYDGMSWTTPGTPVEVRDRWAINDFINVTHPTEAVWGKDFVRCLGTPRSTQYGAVTCDGAPLPACPQNVSLTTWGDAQYWLKLDPQ